MKQSDPTTWAWFPDQYDWVDITTEVISPGDEIALVYIDLYITVTKEVYFDPEASWSLHANKHERNQNTKGLYCIECDIGNFYLDADDSVRRKKPHARAEKGV